MQVNSQYNDKEIMAVTREALHLGETAYMRVKPILKGGSTRSYFRIHFNHKDLYSALHGNNSLVSSLTTAPNGHEGNCENDDSIVFMQYDRYREENNYYVPIADFLLKIGVKTPHIIYHNPNKGYVVMEDLGEKDLWSFRDASWEVRRCYYFRTLEIMHKLHSFPLQEFPSEKVPLMAGFDTSLYRWERNYFLENFVQAVCHIKLDSYSVEILEKELASLAEKLENYGMTLVHRDFQSQNVMIQNNEPVLIDFQGLRFGSPVYDLGSLLYDPYVIFTDRERLELLEYYYKLSARGQSWEEFQEIFRLASIQRLMQALGAYGYIALKLHKHEYLQYVPNGLKNILDAASRVDCLPNLINICLEYRMVSGLDI